MNASIRFLAGGATGVLIAGLLAGTATAAPLTPNRQPGVSGSAASDQTSSAEARRVDRVPTPKLAWYPCYDRAECALVRLPLDYDKPKGATVEIAVLRVKAKDQANKIGSLFVNPGGPGGSGVSMALAAPYFLGTDVLNRFDVVGFDPRGVESSDQIKCFTTTGDQTVALAGMNVFFPYGPAQEQAYVDSARALGKACSGTGRLFSGAMSTAEAARDMDVLRRAVGDTKLSYLGFSYGTAIGQYYANMFPDRVRAIVIDGVLDPEAWAGTTATQNLTLEDRLKSAEASYRALQEIFKRCDQAGPELCQLSGHLAADFALVADRLRAAPLVIDDGSGFTYTITYADFIANALSSLYDPSGYEFIVSLVSDLLTMTDPSVPADAAQRTAARLDLVKRLADQNQKVKPGRWDFPYANGAEAFAGVICTDGLYPEDAGQWPAITAAADERAPYFGRAWGWGSPMCARKTWTVRDPDAYRGPFTRRTSAPVLIVGNYWDPATRYEGAVAASRLLPNSRLLSSDSWGHAAYGTSACVTNAVDAYLLQGVLPAEGTICVGDIQPFAAAPDKQEQAASANSERPATDVADLVRTDPPAAGERKELPPVVAPAPLAPAK